MGSEQKYPELAKYLKSARFGDRIRRMKQPTYWLGQAVFVGGMILIFMEHYALALLLVVASFPLSYLIEKRRLGVGTARELVVKDTKQRMPEYVQRSLKENKLESTIGREAADALERCAKLVNSMYQRIVDEDLMGGDRPIDVKAIMRRVGEGAEALMRGGLAVLYRPLMMRFQATEVELAALAKVETSLTALHHEVFLTLPPSNTPEFGSEAQAQIDRVQALLELNQGSDQGAG